LLKYGARGLSAANTPSLYLYLCLYCVILIIHRIHNFTIS
jgi:hypothetical protein